MKNMFYFWLLVLLLGCGKEEPRSQQQRVVYPALNESSPPPPPPFEGDAAELVQLNKQPEIPCVITGDRWIDLKDEMDVLVKSLRDYSEKADPDDPFAMTEEEIRKLSEQVGLCFY